MAMSSPQDPPTRVARPASGVRPALSFVLSGVMILIYLGFILLVAYNKPFMGSTIVPGLSWGILLGALVIISAWLLTLFYVVAAGRRSDVR